MLSLERLSRRVKGLRITYEAISASVVRCRIDVTDPARIGHAAELRIIRRVTVKDRRPVHASEVLVKHRIEKLEIRNVVDLERRTFQAFSYTGHRIDIDIHTELKIADGFLFDTKLTEESELAFSPRPKISGNAKEITEPDDRYELMSNMAALSTSGRVATAGLMLLGAFVIAFNTLKKQLRGYMTFELHGVPKRIGRGDRLPVKSHVRGQSRVALDDVVIRVVASNVEKGQYVVGAGKSRAVKSFVEPVRALVLYEKRLARIPAGTRIESLLDGEIDFGPMFRSLYPPQRVSRTHALDVYWEVQLLSGKYVDQEVIGPVECFPWSEFLAA
jgi:hypothetical protein